MFVSMANLLIRLRTYKDICMVDHFENENTEKAMCNGNNFELY